ncbi:MAG TPA: hypothetical protein VH796_01000 [Nitrososphaeraceae archaeon]
MNNKWTNELKRNNRIKSSLPNLSGSLTTPHIILASIKTVFSSWYYIAIAASIFIIFWIIFSVFDQLLFFIPIFIFYLPDDAVTGFIIYTITAILLGMVVSMNVYVLRHSRGLKINTKSFFSGSTLSVLSSTCASCSSLGFLLVSTFGGIGVTASTFLSNYQTTLRIVSIVLLVWALYSISSKLNKSCKLGYKTNKENKDK